MGKLESERVVVSAPMSFAGSARRIWGWKPSAAWGPWVIGPFLLALIVCVWLLVAAWYVAFGLLVVPWRLLRRGFRKRKRDELRHREVLDASERRDV